MTPEDYKTRHLTGVPPATVPEAPTVKCNRCGKTGLRWRQVSDGWRLYDEIGAHYCRHPTSWSAWRFRSGWTLIETAIVICILAILFVVLIAPVTTCKAKAKAMGFRSDYGLAQGCMIEVKPGQWVPIENYRVL